MKKPSAFRILKITILFLVAALSLSAAATGASAWYDIEQSAQNEFSGGAPDGSVTKTTAATEVTAGDSYAYTITVSNSSSAAGAWKNVTASDTLPATLDFMSGRVVDGDGNDVTSDFGVKVSEDAGIVTIACGDIAIGETVTVQITVTVHEKAAVGDTIVNTVVVSSDNDEDKTDTDDTPVVTALSVTGTYTVVYAPNGGTGSQYSVTENLGSAHTVLVNSNANIGFTRFGYVFRGWSPDANATSASYFGTGGEAIGQAAADGDTITLYAVWSRLYSPGGGGDSGIDIDEDDVPLGSLDLSNHFAYIIGYPDGTVQPGGNITRAEVATIFFRLLTQESREELWSKTNGFSDTDVAAWYNNAVSTLANGNILKGYSDETFQPNASITRAEFATIAVRFAGAEDIANATGTAAFSDIAGHWAEDNVALAGALGYVQGYGDGTFRPDEPITRAEVATLLNNVLGRHVESEDDMLSDMITWPDSQTGTWFYSAMQEATNSHFYDSKEDSINESWTELRPAPDWVALEKPGSEPGDVNY